MRMRYGTLSFAATLLLVFGSLLPAVSQDDAADEAVRQSAEKLAATFNAGKAEEFAAMFLPQGELIDEAGTVYQGTQEITDLVKAFFQQFPDTKLALAIESIRQVGPVAIEEGTRTMTTADGAVESRFRYIAVWAKADKEWKLASFRDFADDPVPSAHEQLQPLAWLEGEWVNEGADGKVAISYRWTDDKNFLIGEFQMTPADGVTRTSTQRIGWDPSLGKIRSWLFDADGGFGEGEWTPVDDGIIVKSSSVNPDGTTATATMTVRSENKDRFTIAGTDRIVGGNLEEDFEITVVRRPPTAGKK